MRRRLAAAHQRAFIGEIVVFVIGFLLIGGGVTALAYSLKLGAATIALALNNGARMALVDQFQPDARSAMFVGILPTDINGNAQGSSTASELDFYTRDSAHNPYLWAYNYNAATQTVQRYCFTDPTTHANLKACGQSLSNVTAFTVTVQTASSAASGNLALAGTTIQNIGPQGLSVPGVTSSNQVVSVHLVTSDADELHTLVAGIGPTGYTTIVGRYWKPGPLLVNGSATGFAVDEPVGQSLCYYQSDGSTHNPCTVGVTEQYYGGGGEDTPGNFAINMGNCNSGVTIAPSVAAANSTTPVIFTITSTSPQACTAYIVDDHGGSDPLQVTIWGPLVTNPAKLDFLVGGNTNPTAYNAGGASEGADPNGSLTVSEQNYAGPFTLTDGDGSGNNACGSNVSASWNGGGWYISTPPSATPGDCIMNITDGHGGQNLLSIHIGAPLLVNTGSGFSTSGSLSWVHPTGSQTYQVQELVYTGPFNLSDSCSGNITDTLSSGAGSGTLSGYTVTPSVGPLSCAITITDTRGNTATVSVSVADPALVPQFVCDPNNPPSPAGTDLGPDPDGIHEDYSNGTWCGATPTPAPTPSPSGGHSAADSQCSTGLCVTMDYNAGQSLLPYYGPSYVAYCEPGSGAFCPFLLGSIPVDMSRVDNSRVCFIDFYLLNQDNGGEPPIVFGGLSDVLTPVAVYNSATGFLYVPIQSGLSGNVWLPNGEFSSQQPAAAGDLYYIGYLMPPYLGTPKWQYFWVALSDWVLPVGTSDAGPDPPWNAEGLSYTGTDPAYSECGAPWGATLNSVNIHLGPDY